MEKLSIEEKALIKMWESKNPNITFDEYTEYISTPEIDKKFEKYYESLREAELESLKARVHFIIK